MITNFIENYAKLIVSVPEDVTVTIESIDDTFAEITVEANSSDIGKLIGKNGNMINALKTMVVKQKTVYHTRYKLLQSRY